MRGLKHTIREGIISLCLRGRQRSSLSRILPIKQIFCRAGIFGFYNTGFAIGNYNQGFYAAFSEDSYYRHELGFWCKKAYVRGNIFDNKELLQKNK